MDGKVKNRGIFTLDDNDNTQAEFIKKLNDRPALLLNADYQPLSYMPLSLWSWQDAVKAIFSGKVQVVDVYPDVMIRGASLEVPLPSVIALTEYVNHVNKRPAFTRRNIFLRDEYKCQYCAERFHTADLSLDHVVPRCMGGQLNW
jgi:5-methylcytosine-specific restriction endonuclease McrA